MRRPRCTASGAPSACSRTGQRPSSCRTTRCLSSPLFVEKVRDVVGLYRSPPERALVLCVDEKSQIQAPDRSQPLLPRRPGQVERRTHDDTRHGTTSLFAPPNIASGTIIGRCYPKHRSSECRKFLDQIEAGVPADLVVHLVMDNDATHKTKPIRDWLAKRPRWHVHFTPTGASWINQVERFFALITDKQIRRGVHRSTQQLEADIRAFIDAHNASPKPFQWTKSANDILAAIQRFCQRSQQTRRITESGHSSMTRAGRRTARPLARCFGGYLCPTATPFGRTMPEGGRPGSGRSRPLLGRQQGSCARRRVRAVERRGPLARAIGLPAPQQPKQAGSDPRQP